MVVLGWQFFFDFALNPRPNVHGGFFCLTPTPSNPTPSPTQPSPTLSTHPTSLSNTDFLISNCGIQPSRTPN
jgi:hypothetical protein